MKLVTSVLEDSRFWQKSYRVWRILLELKVYKHTHPEAPDRWVVQTTVVYDRSKVSKSRKATTNQP